MNDPLTDEQLNEMARRCQEATSGPWISYVEGRNFESGSSFVRTGGEDIYLSGATTADQDFIASARQDVPTLIEEVRYLRNAIADLRKTK